MIEAATWFAVVTLVVTLLLTGAIAGVNVGRRSWARLRARRAAQPRRILLAVVADADPAGGEQLARLPAAQWRAVEPTAFDLLSKVRGEGRTALVAAFERRATVERARRGLRRFGAVRRARSATVLGQLGDRSAAADLCVLRRDPHDEVRVTAVRALGRIGDPAAAGPLLASVGAARPTPSLQVAHALAQLGTAAAPECVAALGDDDPLVRMTALDALRLLGAAGVESAVLAVLRDDWSPAVRVRATLALRRIGTSESVPALLASTAPDRPTAVRAAAAGALGELRSVSARGVLAALLICPEYPVAHEAAAALVALGAPGRRVLVVAAAGAGRAGAHAREALAIDTLARRRAVTAAAPVPVRPGQ